MPGLSGRILRSHNQQEVYWCLVREGNIPYTGLCGDREVLMLIKKRYIFIYELYLEESMNSL